MGQAETHSLPREKKPDSQREQVRASLHCSQWAGQATRQMGLTLALSTLVEVEGRTGGEAEERTARRVVGDLEVKGRAEFTVSV